jgi:hypothetical protein
MKEFSRGLKPRVYFYCSIGTTEVVPFQNKRCYQLIA